MQDIKGVGRKGDVSDVSDGYARNFLMPKKLAEPVTEKKVQAIAAAKKHHEELKAREQQEYRKLVEKFKNVTLDFTRKADKSGSTFGSVTEKDIAQELEKKLRFAVGPSFVELPHHLKKVGEHFVDINLGHGIRGKIKTKITGI